MNRTHLESCLVYTLSSRIFHLEWFDCIMKSLYSVHGVEKILIVFIILIVLIETMNPIVLFLLNFEFLLLEQNEFKFGLCSPITLVELNMP